MEKRKKIIGILGGIGSGKSTVAGELQKLGCGIIDADKIVHDLLETETVIRKVCKAFGDKVLTDDGQIDRAKLAKNAFNSKENINTLNEIIHPCVFAISQGMIEDLNEMIDVKAIVLDVPLLLEVGWEKIADVLIFVDCKDSSKTDRKLKKAVSDENLRKKRENFQISLDNKAEIADYIVDNNSGLKALADQIARIFTNIIN
jgi:dephospho-CoA kinase